MMRKAVLFGLGVLSLSRERAEKIMAEMVEKGEVNKEEARQFVDETIRRGEEEKELLRKMIKQELLDIKNTMPIVSRAEYEELEKRLKALEDRLQQES